MPYALFCNEAKLSKAYPTEADVWKLARRSGLVVDVEPRQGKLAPRPLLDNDYEIRSCRPDPSCARIVMRDSAPQRQPATRGDAFRGSRSRVTPARRKAPRTPSFGAVP